MGMCDGTAQDGCALQTTRNGPVHGTRLRSSHTSRFLATRRLVHVCFRNKVVVQLLSVQIFQISWRPPFSWSQDLLYRRIALNQVLRVSSSHVVCPIIASVLHS